MPLVKALKFLSLAFASFAKATKKLRKFERKRTYLSLSTDLMSLLLFTQSFRLWHIRKFANELILLSRKAVL